MSDLRFTAKQTEALIVAADFSLAEEILNEEQEDDIKFVRSLFHDHRKGVRISDVPNHFKPIMRMLAQNVQNVSKQTWSSIALKTMQAGCGLVI